MFSPSIGYVESTPFLSCFETLIDEQVQAMDLSTKVLYLKRNPVIVAPQVD